MATTVELSGFDDSAQSDFGMLPNTQIATGQVPQGGVALPDYEDLAAGDDHIDECAGEQIWGRNEFRGLQMDENAAVLSADHPARSDGDFRAFPVRGRADQDRRSAPGAGGTMRSIGAELGRSPGTISRELHRNRDTGSGEYRPHGAQNKAQARRPRPKRGKLAKDPVLREYVQSCLEKRWSPEQISHQLPG